MTSPNTLKSMEPTQAVEPSHAEATGALALRATEHDVTAGQATTEREQPTGEPRMTSWRAIQGPHPRWLGFSAITGEPKVKR